MFTPNHVSHVMCHVSHVRCHMAGVTCQVSHVMRTFFISIFLDKVVELVGEGSVINRA